MSDLRGQRESIASDEINMGKAERGQAFHIGERNRFGLLMKVLHRFIHVNRIPQNDRIEDKAQGTELVFLAFAVALAQFTALPMKHGSC